MESQRCGFLPRIRSLECHIGRDIVPFIPLFPTPTIAVLDLSFPRKNTPLLQPALSLILHACRRLQLLRINIGTSSSPSGGGIGRLISASRSALRSIEIQPSTPPEAFPPIFDLPLLRNFALGEPRFPSQVPSELLPLRRFSERRRWF